MTEPATMTMQIASVKRELALRQRVYPKQVQTYARTEGRYGMSQQEVDKETRSMTAVLHTLMALAAEPKASCAHMSTTPLYAIIGDHVTPTGLMLCEDCEKAVRA